MSWLELVHHERRSRPFTQHTLATECIPLLICYYLSALLVILPRTFLLRLALLPATLFLMGNAALNWDFSDGNPRLVYLNQALLVIMTTLIARVVIWTCQVEPYKRLTTKHSTISQIFLDSWDLCFNIRGIGWSWSTELCIPAETRPYIPLPSFLWRRFISFLIHLLMSDVFHYAIQSSDFLTIGSPAGGTIFDPNLPPALRYLRSTSITFFTALIVYGSIETAYCLSTCIVLPIFGQQPSQWPPMFDSPWFSTSLPQLWGRRWHQLFRHYFIACGGRPFALMIRSHRFGTVFGSFFASGLLHYFGLWGMGRGADFVPIVGFFVMMGFGVALEDLWKCLSGRRVCGFWGWLWTMAWALGWGNLLVDAWTRKGLVGSMFWPYAWRPSEWAWGMLGKVLRP